MRYYPPLKKLSEEDRMEHKHLDAAALEHLLAIDRSAQQNEQLFHLLAVCPRCREVGGWLLELYQANALPPVFGPIDAALAWSRTEAPQLLEALLPLAPEERLACLHTGRRFVSWGLCELLVRRSSQAASEQVSEAVHLADLAVHMADMTPGGELFEERWVYQLRSLAWASLGNARRAQGDLSGAERCFDMADSWWEAGTVSTEDALGYEPVLWDLKASLRMAQRRFPEAIQLLDDAIDLLLKGEHRDPHLAGRSLIKKALVLVDMGASEPAIQALKKANGLIDPEREPRLLLCVHHNLVDNLSKVGRHQEAADLLPELKALAAIHGCTLDRLRLAWVEGRVAAGLGDHDQARSLLTQVRQRFLADANVYEAALATLDLVIPNLKEGKTAEVRDLADEMVTVFRDHDVAREALAALLLFQEAARQETATGDLAREVAASLIKARGSAAKLPKSDSFSKLEGTM
jgi:tetratricopeptide (TPR) repeat protein